MKIEYFKVENARCCLCDGIGEMEVIRIENSLHGYTSTEFHIHCIEDILSYTENHNSRKFEQALWIVENMKIFFDNKQAELDMWKSQRQEIIDMAEDLL